MLIAMAIVYAICCNSYFYGNVKFLSIHKHRAFT